MESVHINRTKNELKKNFQLLINVDICSQEVHQDLECIALHSSILTGTTPYLEAGTLTMWMQETPTCVALSLAVIIYLLPPERD